MSKNKLIKPAFRYPGGKTKMLKTILPLIPRHQRYVEPFAGGLAVLLSKPRVPAEVINDLNSEVANFYRYVRDHREGLLCELSKYHLHSREDFKMLLESSTCTDLARAVRWFLLNAMSFAGQGKTFGRGISRTTGFNRERFCAQIELVGERLNKVLIENKDWQEIVEEFDCGDTFYFFDPPYLDCGKTAYDAFGAEDLGRLRDALKRLKGKWLLTCNDTPSVRSIFAGLPAQVFHSNYSIGARTPAAELIIIHPEIAPPDVDILNHPDK